jgi:hypothetical protein
MQIKHSTFLLCPALMSDVPIENEIRRGDVVNCIIECSEGVDAVMTVMRASDGKVISQWKTSCRWETGAHMVWAIVSAADRVRY